MRCKRCIMDDTASDILFDENGICNFCTEAKNRIIDNQTLINNSSFHLEKAVERIKKSNKRNTNYDCVIGLSGGVDSSYLAYFVRKILKLNPIAVHLDNGWNSNLAIDNIEKIVKKLDIDLETIVLRWDEFSSFQTIFLKSDVINAEIPTDHACQASLFYIANKLNIKYILGGGNISSESIMPDSWSEDPKDFYLIN